MNPRDQGMFRQPTTGCLQRRHRYTVVAVLMSALLIGTSWIAMKFMGFGPKYVLSMALVCAVLIVVPAHEQARLIERARIESMTDSLTGLCNRRAVVARLYEELARCSRMHEPLAVLMIDVDRLKEINDNDSHHAGDDALRSVARVLRSSTRVSDTVGRLGGDEFLVIAPATTRDTAASLAARIAEDMNETRIDALGGRRIRLSIGVAVRSGTSAPSAECVQNLLDTADHAMYVEKMRHDTVRQERRLVAPRLSLRIMQA